MVWDPRSDSGWDVSAWESPTADMACVCVAPSRDEAEAYREMLDDFDIPSVLGRPDATFSSYVSRFASVLVLVRPDLLRQAREILECFTATDDPDEWDDDFEEEDDDYDDDDDDDDDDDYDDDDDDDDYDDDDDDDFEEDEEFDDMD